MPRFHIIFTAALTGFLSGLLVSIPVGPVNLTIMNEGARQGFRRAALVGLGATAMEVIYCAIAFTGFASFFSHGYVKAAMELCSFVVILGLGLKLLLTKTVPSTSRIGEKIETKLHPHSAFMAGFVRTMGNPNVLLFWIILAANFISREWVAPTWTGKGACVAGVALGTGGWFFGLSWVVSLRHGKLSDRTLLRMQKGSGIVLLILGVMHGIQIIWEMAQQRGK
jgi:threonine/homoserine/homoserine lactone efflux protein